MALAETREKLENALSRKVTIENRDVFVFGAGNTSMLYDRCFKLENIHPKAFIDNDKKKQGQHFLGHDVLSLERAAQAASGDPVIFINAQRPNAVEEIRASLKNSAMADCEIRLVDEYVFPKNADSILSVYDMLEDDISKRTYANRIMARMGVENTDTSIVTGRQYFCLPEFSALDPSECFVDCGAYVGDTLEQYIFAKSGQFGHIYAFEPSHRNYVAMCKRIERLNAEWALDDSKITAIEAAAGMADTEMYMSWENFDSASVGASLTHESRGGEDKKTRVYAINSYFRDIEVSYIKADIESCEYEMLKGADKVIKRDKPLLAVCIYHNASDMYSIAKLIKEIDSSYRLSVRHHTFFSSDTVLYAY